MHTRIQTHATKLIASVLREDDVCLIVSTSVLDANMENPCEHTDAKAIKNIGQPEMPLFLSFSHFCSQIRQLPHSVAHL